MCVCERERERESEREREREKICDTAFILTVALEMTKTTDYQSLKKDMHAPQEMDKAACNHWRRL